MSKMGNEEVLEVIRVEGPVGVNERPSTYSAKRKNRSERTDQGGHQNTNDYSGEVKASAAAEEKFGGQTLVLGDGGNAVR